MAIEYSFELGNFTDAFDNITSGRFVVGGDVDGVIYKSYERALGREVAFKDHIKCMVEANAGAHYYAHGPYTGDFTHTKALVDLAKLRLNRCGRDGKACRNAYLCLGYISGGKLWHIDTGLCNNQEKDTWAAFLCDFGLGEPEEATFKDLAAFNTDKYPGARYFETEVDLGHCTPSEDVVKCIYRFLDENRTVLGEIVATMRKPAGMVFERDGGLPKSRLVRFMSLVPRSGKGTDDNADGTFLESTMEELTIDGKPWTEKDLDYIWSVQASNINNLQISNLGGNPVGEDVDIISLYHDKQLS